MVILNIEPATNFSGGVNQTILNTLELKKRGHKVYLACVKGSPVHEKLKDFGVEFVFIDNERFIQSAKCVSSFLEKHRVDIVHTHHSKGHTIGLLSLMFRKRERLVVQRGVIFPAKNPFKYLNPRVNLFVANSNVVKERLVKSFVSRKKIVVVYSAIDENRVSGYNRDEIRHKFGFEGRFVFGVVGNYSKWKGQDMLLEAFAGIKNRGNVMLVFVGKNTELLEDRARELGVGDRVRAFGFRDDAPKIIKGFDCLVIPSKEGESFPNVAVEAFFSKTVVAGTNVGGVPELLDDGRGFVCEPNVDSLKGLMLTVYNYDKREEMAERAYRFAKENLTIEKKVDKLEKIYSSLLPK